MVKEKSDNAISPDVRVFHDGEDTLAVWASTSEAIEEICQTILMQGTRDQQSHRNR